LGWGPAAQAAGARRSLAFSDNDVAESGAASAPRGRRGRATGSLIRLKAASSGTRMLASWTIA